MGCGSSNAQVAALNDSNTEKQTDEGQTMEANEDEERPKSYPPPEAFEIPIDESNVDGLIKKHPPKRLLRLEEQALQTSPPTMEDLEEKLATAELRRQDYLNQKVTMAKQMQKQLEESMVERRDGEEVEDMNDEKETNEKDIN